MAELSEGHMVGVGGEGGQRCSVERSRVERRETFAGGSVTIVHASTLDTPKKEVSTNHSRQAAEEASCPLTKI